MMYVLRPPYFDPDDFGGGFGGGYSGENENKINEEEMELYHESLLPIYSSNNTNIIFMGGNNTSLESDS